jgi:hypothetical protein
MAKHTNPLVSSFLAGDDTPQLGTRNEVMGELQRALLAAGHDPGTIDGWYGRRTHSALQAYRIAHRPVVTPPPPASSPSDYDAIARRILDVARADWQARVGEHDMRPGSKLADIFRDSAWSDNVDKKESGGAKDWCGMSVAAWMFRCGLQGALRNDYWATSNVRSGLSYATAGTVHHRTDREVQPPGSRDWLLVEAWHTAQGQRRSWIEGDELHAIDVRQWDIRPGDVLLIAHDGSRERAHHITMVERWEPQELMLHTIEGNASGLDALGKRLRNGVVKVSRNLSGATTRNTIFGFGRPSALDFIAADYRR